MVTDKWQAGLCNKAGECPSRVRVGSVYSPRGGTVCRGLGGSIGGGRLGPGQDYKGHC